MKKIFGKALSFVLVLQLVLSAFYFAIPVSADTVNRSRMLKVNGNKIVLEENPNVAVRLTGLNLDGAEWTATPSVEKLDRSLKEAIENWDTNLIRLPVSVAGWYGGYSYFPDGGVQYRAYIDTIIKMASEVGIYVDLDLHQYNNFNNQKYLDFWKDAAEKYGNNPTVLFGILNEPTSASWDEWRNGNGSNITGHQQVVEMIRDLGAGNIIIAGGLGYAGNLSGITGNAKNDSTVYALIDQGSNADHTKTGNGIMYDAHIYPWTGRTASWDAVFGVARKQYPILIGENGWDADTIKTVAGWTIQPGDPLYYDKWIPELFAWMNDEQTYGNLANWAGFCFHPLSSPRILGDPGNWKNDAIYTYPPTPYWGIFVKNELKADLGFNAVLNKTVTSSSSDQGLDCTNAVDDNHSTFWASTEPGDKYITVDLWNKYDINRWVVRHAGTGGNNVDENTRNFKLQVSNDNKTWIDVDSITGNTCDITDRFVQPTEARYVRLYVTAAAQNDDRLKIYEFSVFGKESTANIETALPVSVVGNAGRGTISHWFAAQNFDNATANTSDAKAIDAPNLANHDYIEWKQDTTATAGLYTISKGDASNASNYISGSAKSNVPIEMTLETHGANGTATAAPAIDNGNLIYADMRVKRASLTDNPVSLKMKDSSGNEIFEISYTANAMPQLKADQIYGNLTNNPMKTVVSCPYTDDWIYLRARINFVNKTFELYQGPTLNAMIPFVTGTTSFKFKNANALNLYKISVGDGGVLGIDDVNIYSVSAPFAPSTHSVFFKVDSTVVATMTIDEGSALKNLPVVPIRGGYTGVWDTPENTIITADKSVNAIYTFIPKSVQTNMNDSCTPGIWGGWGGTSIENLDGKAENGVSKALYLSGGDGSGGAQIAMTSAGFNDFTDFDAFSLRIKSTAPFQVRMELQYKVDQPNVVKDSKAFTIASTNGVWQDVMIPASALKPNTDGDWVYKMKSVYTSGNFQPVVLMQFVGTNFGADNYATIGNIKALWNIDPVPTHTVTFIADGIIVATRIVEDGATLTDIPTPPALTGLTGVWGVTNYANITEDKIVTAVYTPTVYTVTFIADGLTVATRTVNYGGTLPDIPDCPKKAGFLCAWRTTDFSKINKDITVYADYTPLSVDRLSIGAITMSEPVDGKLTFHVPYSAPYVDYVTILATIGSGSTEPAALTGNDIVYVNAQAPAGESSFDFKVAENRFTDENNKIFIKIGGMDANKKAASPLTYPDPEQTYSTTATITVTNGILSVDYGAQNNSKKTNTASVIVAIYNDNGQLIGTQINTDSYTSHQQRSYRYSLDCTGLKYSYFKVFVFDDINQLHPLALVYDSRTHSN